MRIFLLYIFLLHNLLLYNADVRADSPAEPSRLIINSFSAADIEAILREQGWLRERAASNIEQWMRDAAEWLGLQVARRPSDEQRASLRELLTLIFSYDATRLLESRENQAAMALDGARDVIRELASRVLVRETIDSEQLREIIAELKAIFGSNGRKIFYPLRLALAGRTGEGELDRVILLLDRATSLPFKVPVKGARQRMLEFCAALG